MERTENEAAQKRERRPRKPPFLSHLNAGEDHAGDVLLALRDDGVGAAHREALLLEGLHDRQEDHGAALLVTVVLAEVDAPVGVFVRIGCVRRRGGVTADKEELGRLAGPLGRQAGRRVLRERLLQSVDGVLAEAGALDGDGGGVEGAGDHDVGHDGRGGAFFFF